MREMMPSLRLGQEKIALKQGGRQNTGDMNRCRSDLEEENFERYSHS